MADQIAERLKKTLPPELQDNKDGEEEVPPQAAAEIAQLKQGVEQLSAALQNASAEVDTLEAKSKSDDRKLDLEGEKTEVARYTAETARLQLVMPYLTPESLNEIAATVGVQARTSPDIFTGLPAGGPEQQQPASAGFSLPA
jgi:hypothetical protein